MPETKEGPLKIRIRFNDNLRAFAVHHHFDMPMGCPGVETDPLK